MVTNGVVVNSDAKTGAAPLVPDQLFGTLEPETVVPLIVVSVPIRSGPRPQAATAT